MTLENINKKLCKIGLMLLVQYEVRNRKMVRVQLHIMRIKKYDQWVADNKERLRGMKGNVV